MTSARSGLDEQAGPDASRVVSLSGLNMAVTELLYPVGRSPSPSLELANLEEAKRLIENAHASLLAAVQARSQKEKDLPALESASVTTVTLLAHEELCAVVMMELHGVYDDPCWSDIGDISGRLQRALGYVEQVLNTHRSNTTTTEK